MECHLPTLYCLLYAFGAVIRRRSFACNVQEEEDAAAAAKSAKQARKKARKKAAKAATLPTDSPQQPLATDDTHTRDATAAGQSLRVDADSSAGGLPDPQPPSHPDAAASATAPMDAGNEPDNSWQLCPLSKVSGTGSGPACGDAMLGCLAGPDKHAMLH